MITAIIIRAYTYCSGCGRALGDTNPDGICEDCRKKQLSLLGVRRCAHFQSCPTG